MSLPFLAPGERLVALLREDREVRLLTEGLFVIGGGLAALLLSMVLRQHDDPPPDLGGLAITYGIPLATAWVVAALRAPACYALTDRRLIVDPFGRPSALPLDEITVVRRWFGNLRLNRRTGRGVVLMNLREAVAVAALIEDRVGA